MRSELHSMARVVREGLTSTPKRLPPVLFYDRLGSELFERITELPEYYLTRTEHELLALRAEAIIQAAKGSTQEPLTILELGAGTATKTEVLLRAVVRLQGATRFIPADVSESPLEEARLRLSRAMPLLEVSPFVGAHREALLAARRIRGPMLVLFLGSSIGDYEPTQAAELLSWVAATLGDRGSLLLGTDLKKPLTELLPAYDDAAGVTAAFNRNVLVRINRELGGRFDPGSFRHVALWNERAGAVEMHLESTCAQQVRIDALDLNVSFERGERIHTESSHKYDRESVRHLLRASGLSPVTELQDSAARYALQLVIPASVKTDAPDFARLET